LYSTETSSILAEAALPGNIGVPSGSSVGVGGSKVGVGDSGVGVGGSGVCVGGSGVSEGMRRVVGVVSGGWAALEGPAGTTKRNNASPINIAPIPNTRKRAIFPIGGILIADISNPPPRMPIKKKNAPTINKIPSFVCGIIHLLIFLDAILIMRSYYSVARIFDKRSSIIITHRILRQPRTLFSIIQQKPRISPILPGF
jgi:hypothetical protein